MIKGSVGGIFLGILGPSGVDVYPELTLEKLQKTTKQRDAGQGKREGMDIPAGDND